jgi:hypothetical protein
MVEHGRGGVTMQLEAKHNEVARQGTALSGKNGWQSARLWTKDCSSPFVFLSSLLVAKNRNGFKRLVGTS